MLINSVIIVLREVLEAGLLVSVLLALSARTLTPFRWLLVAIPFGVAGATLYASNLESVSTLFDYTGQEITNSLLQLLIYLCVAMLVILFPAPSADKKPINLNLVILMGLTIALAITREGSEILIYLSGLLHKPEATQPVVIGSLIGAGIGTSIGALVYYGLSSRKPATLFIIGKCLLVILATGILSQSIPLLIQADILEAAEPLWDTTAILSEESITGQLLYAASGYEATPAPQQAYAYLSGIAFIVTGLLINHYLKKTGQPR